MPTSITIALYELDLCHALHLDTLTELCKSKEQAHIHLQPFLRLRSMMEQAHGAARSFLPIVTTFSFWFSPSSLLDVLRIKFESRGLVWYD